jgi:hypothetical protein
MDNQDFDPMLDSYLSWEAFIAEMRRRWLAGEDTRPGPWYKSRRQQSGHSSEATKLTH